MNRTPDSRTIIFGTSLATLLVATILVLTGGREQAPAPIPAPAGEAALPMLSGVNRTQQSSQTNQPPNETPAKAETKPATATPPNR